MKFDAFSDYFSNGLRMKQKIEGNLALEIDSTNFTGKSHKNFISDLIDVSDLNKNVLDSQSNLFFEIECQANVDSHNPHVIILSWYDKDMCSIESGGLAIEENIQLFPSTKWHKFVFKITKPPVEFEFLSIKIYQNLKYNCKILLKNARFQIDGCTYLIKDNSTETEIIDSSIKWEEDGNTLWVTSYLGAHFIKFGEGVSARNFTRDRHLVDLAEYMLFSKIDNYYLGDNGREKRYRQSIDFEECFREKGSKVALFFSGGEDSTAALQLLPKDTIPITIIRPYDSYRLSNGSKVELPPNEPLERIIAASGSVPITTNIETLGLSAGMRHGFLDSAGYLAIAAMFCDAENIGCVALGSVMEQIYLGSGHRFVDVTDPERKTLSALQYRLKLFSKIGIDVTYPTGGCSEVVTHEICKRSKYADLVVPCPTADSEGKPCKKCFKCFRKFGMEGELILELDNSAKMSISAFPIKSATSTVYSTFKSGFRNEYIDRYKDVDLSWLERYYIDSYEYLLPDYLRQSVLSRFEKIGIDPMTSSDIKNLKSVGEIFNNPAFGIE